MSKDYKDNRKKEQAQQAYIYLVKTLSLAQTVRSLLLGVFTRYM